MPQTPGIQYSGNDPVIRNIYDNLLYLRQTVAPVRFAADTTLTLAKITVSGTDGSITITPNGVVSAFTAPT